ncbi:hypothetical protein MMC09_001094 [Bachmanniomyces sp. S44760]|nr:hypothetical protein [Bachmanniomyces sp. S44760]
MPFHTPLRPYIVSLILAVSIIASSIILTLVLCLARPRPLNVTIVVSVTVVAIVACGATAHITIHGCLAGSLERYEDDLESWMNLKHQGGDRNRVRAERVTETQKDLNSPKSVDDPGLGTRDLDTDTESHPSAPRIDDGGHKETKDAPGKPESVSQVLKSVVIQPQPTYLGPKSFHRPFLNGSAWKGNSRPGTGIATKKPPSILKKRKPEGLESGVEREREGSRSDDVSVSVSVSVSDSDSAGKSPSPSLGSQTSAFPVFSSSGLGQEGAFGKEQTGPKKLESILEA